MLYQLPVFTENHTSGLGERKQPVTCCIRYQCLQRIILVVLEKESSQLHVVLDTSVYRESYSWSWRKKAASYMLY